MNDFTALDHQTSKISELKKLTHPSKDALFFVQLFARVYEPQEMMGVA